MGLREIRIQIPLGCSCSDVNRVIICIKCGLHPKSIKLCIGWQEPVFLWKQFCLCYSFSVCISENDLSSSHPLLGELSHQPRQLITAVRKGVSKQCAYPMYMRLQTSVHILCCSLPSKNHTYLKILILAFTFPSISLHKRPLFQRGECLPCSFQDGYETVPTVTVFPSPHNLCPNPCFSMAR